MAGPAEKTIRRLFAISGNICALLGCPSPLVEVSGTLTGEICHIRAQSLGGPRFDASQSKEARHAYENLILLCRRHHRIVDAEPELYSVGALEELKAIRKRQLGRPEQETDAFYAKLLGFKVGLSALVTSTSMSKSTAIGWSQKKRTALGGLRTVQGHLPFALRGQPTAPIPSVAATNHASCILSSINEAPPKAAEEHGDKTGLADHRTPET